VCFILLSVAFCTFLNKGNDVGIVRNSLKLELCALFVSYLDLILSQGRDKALVSGL
jgi:hypothetical protein